MANSVFEYETELQLQDYVIENFSSFFSFNYIGRERWVNGKYVDIIGEDDETLYIIELKRFAATRETVKQVQSYINFFKYSKKKIKGIVMAPEVYKIDPFLKYGDDNNIEIMLIPNVRCTGSKLSKQQQSSVKYGNRHTMYISANVSQMLYELANGRTILQIADMAVNELSVISETDLMGRIKKERLWNRAATSLTISTETSNKLTSITPRNIAKRQVMELAIYELYKAKYKDILTLFNKDINAWYGQEAFGDWRVSKYNYKTQKALVRAIDKGTLRF